MNELARQLIDRYQHDFPLCSRPYEAMASEMGVSEQAVIECLQQLSGERVLSRVGPVFDHNKAGGSTLAALAVPAERLEAVAAIVNGFEEVNHNYSREHHYNLWFVVASCCKQQVQRVLHEIEEETGLPVLYLPMEHSYHIDLGFRLDWQAER